MAEAKKQKSLEEIHLTARAAELRAIIERMATDSPLLARKKAALASIEQELNAVAAR